MVPRIWKISGFTLLATLSLANSSCSIPNIARSTDVTGCGPLKWGMTLDEAKTLLGSQARIDADPGTGAKTEDVTIRMWDIELSGFASTELHTGRINAVHLFNQDGRPIKEQMFETLRRRVTEDYGGPSTEHPLQAGRICFWTFPSGSIIPTSHGNGTVSLAYLQHPLGIGYQTPLQN